jgi:hypothetical protein
MALPKRGRKGSFKKENGKVVLSGHDERHPAVIRLQ